MDNELLLRQKRTSSIRNEIAEMMKETYGEGVDMGSNCGVITTSPPVPKLENLSENVLMRVFTNLTNEHDYDKPVTAGKSYNVYGAQHREMTEFVWRMSGVCASFNHFFNNLSDKKLLQFPRPPIGLRIQPKVPKSAMKHVEAYEEPKVVMYLYGYFSKNNYVMCCKPEEIAAILYPATVETHLIIQSFVLDDGLIEMLKGIDTSKVEEVYFNDVKGVELNEYSVADILNLFPNAMEIRFLGDARFESLGIINNAELPEMEKDSFDELPVGDLVSKYNDVDCRSHNRNKIKRNRRRLIRETEALGDPQPLKKDVNEAQHRSLKRLISHLNNPPKQRSPEEGEVQLKIQQLEEELRTLRGRFSEQNRSGENMEVSSQEW